MEDDIQKKDCISIVDAAEALGVSRSTMENYVRAFQLKKHKFLFDTKAYVERADVEMIRQMREESRQ